ncbi:MAG: DDE-type integrase/transposase/recombinase, partial [Proteobacteria bacterium]|nr:DDE-type integrase/transposase/recombinase [Pseudomonadota bacterium]
MKQRKDNFSTLHQHLKGTDFGGWAAAAPPHIAGGGALVAQNALSIQARITRSDELLSLIKIHITNEDTNDAIDDYVQNLVGAAPAAPPLGPGGAAAAGLLPTDWIAQVWNYIDVTFGQLPQTGLLHSNQGDDWTGAKLIDVGIDRDTPRRFYSHLLRLNRQRQNPHAIIEVWTKYLKQFTFPRAMADDALKQLQNPTFVFAAGPNVGQPDLGSLVDVWEEIWHAIYDRGIEIKPQAAARPSASTPSNRVDGMSAEIQLVDPNDYSWSGIHQAELHEAFIVASGNDASAFLKDERNCWTCRGWGHTKEQCPSSKRARPLSAAISGLQQIQSTQNERLRAMQSSRIRRSGPSPSNRTPTNRPPQATVHAAEELYEYDDGGVYTANGTELVPPVVTPDPVPGTGTEPPMPQSSSVQTVQLATPGAQPSTAIAGIGTAEPPTAVPNDVTEAQLDEHIERQFLSSFSASTHAAPEPDPFVRPEFTRPMARSMATTIACTVAFALGAAAMAVRSTRGRALLTLLVAATPAHAFVTHNHRSSVYSSEFSRNQAMLNGATSRLHGILDSGSTECTSGKRKLFPDHAIERYNPPIKVEIASGVTLPVAFRGGMLIKARKYGTSSSKKTFTVICPGSFYVPDMPVTLVSTKALFRRCRIRVYFNDELVLVTSTGERIGFIETAVNYLLLFDGDDASDVTPTRTPVQPDANFTATLRDPIPITWDLCHSRFCHFSPSRMQASIPYLENCGFDKFGPKPRSDRPCDHCVKGSFRGHRRGARPPGQFTRFGQRTYSDSCVMPMSTPFGFRYMYIFYDAYTKFIAVYFGKTTTAAEMLHVHKQYIADYGRYMAKGHVEQWYVDGGPEFSSTDTVKFCTEMATRMRFIAPWNPWMNVSETGWRIILRPLRIVLAASNVSRRLWPFAVSQIVTVHNALSTASDSAPEGNLARAFFASLTASSVAPPSPFFLVTGKKYDAARLRTLFCEVEVRIRNADDVRAREKTDAVTDTAMHLGIDSRAVGYLVYIFGRSRFTTISFNDTYFRENKLPSLDRIVGSFDFNGLTGLLPTTEQQELDDGNRQFPELDDVVQRPAPADAGQMQQAHRPDVDPGWAHRDATTTHFSRKQCNDRRCQTPSTNGNHDDGDPRHSYERVGDDIRGDPAHRTRARVHNRNNANIVNAIDDDPTGILQPCGHSACPVMLVGDDPDHLTAISYNLEITEYGDVQLPSGTAAALNGPQGKEWRAGYVKDLTAKIENGTFSYVPRPVSEKVIRTKVAHALKRDELTNAVTELRARWVGMGFLQGVNDFLATYTATPTATSLRLFLNMVLVLNLQLAQGDVTKAFTQNPIDVRLYVEQMPGMEVAGDWPGATKENTVCLLHKCLEGLKQAGHIWQTTHTAAILAFRLTSAGYRFKQSTIEPCLFTLHCSAGIIAILVWIDDILVAFTGRALYDAFLKAYKERFPSKHHDGCIKFAGVSIDYKPGVSLQIDQRQHIEMAYDKFIIDKKAASRSSAVSRIAVADRDSARHYSKITLAANDTERSMMKSKPFLAALATVMYISHWTFSHLTYHCSYLSQFMHAPSPHALEADYDMIIYAYHNRNIDIIIYTCNLYTMPRAIPDSSRKHFESSFGLHGYCDASWMLRSVAGYIVLMCNGPVDWASKGLRVICHSSAEAEIAGGCALGKRSVFILQFI